jgi:malonyl-CoA O-methyltransferase
MGDASGSAFDLDRRLLRRAFERAAAGYDRAAFVQREVGGRLIERLDLIKLDPAVIADVGCGTGAITALLLKKYRRARVVGLELAPAMVAATRKRAPWLRTVHGAVADPEALPLASASCDLIFSNLALQWCADLERAFAEFRRALKPGGALLFSTLGPDTLSELRRGWRAADDHNHVNAFFDMHDIGDALVRARLAEPVLDAERLTLTYPAVDSLMGDLKALGAGNVTAGRTRSLTGKGRLRALRAAYERFRRTDGLLPVTCEVVYGHAWGPLQDRPRSRGDGSATFPLVRLRRTQG